MTFGQFLSILRARKWAALLVFALVVATTVAVSLLLPKQYDAAASVVIDIKLGTLSVTDAEKLIADGLRKGNFVKQPQVTLVVLQVRGNQASVLGKVNRPGRYPLEVADMRLTDLLAMAGGAATNGADTVVVTGMRNNQPYRLEVDLPTEFAAGGEDKLVLT